MKKMVVFLMIKLDQFQSMNKSFYETNFHLKIIH